MTAAPDEMDPNDPQAQVSRWAVEFAAAREDVEKWHQRGAKIVQRFKDERKRADRNTRWNLFSSNVQTQMALLYGQVPKVDVSRRFGDAQDDVARVAANVLERILNCDIESPNDGYAQALWHALQDRMLPGMGICRVRYEREERAVEATEAVVGPDGEVLEQAAEASVELLDERAVVDYVPWRDHLWSPARTFGEVRWWAFRAQLSRQQLVERFGELGKLVPLNAGKRKKGDDENKTSSQWGRADVWEVWCKEDRKVYWYVEGFSQLLDMKDDPLELEGFWPFARPMVANQTTDSLLPTPDFALAQDLYDEVDELSTRITLLERAVNVRGAYDGQNTGLRRLLSEAATNDLIPIDNFASFMEKGGIAGAIAWLPLEVIVAAITELRSYRAELVQAVYQVTGMADIMRGQATGPAATATEQSIKAKYGSVRMQALQDEFARFASDLQRIKAEVMSKFFSPQTLLKKSNIELTQDAQLAAPAVELIKSRFGMYRVEVKPESVSLADFAAQQGEAAQFVAGVSQFLTAAAPLAQSVPGSTEALLELLGLVMSRFRFAGGEAEGIIDRAIAQLKATQQQMPAGPPPDPKLQAAQLKAATDTQKVILEHRADMERIAAETQAEVQKQAAQARFNAQEELARAAIKRRYETPKLPGGLP